MAVSPDWIKSSKAKETAQSKAEIENAKTHESLAVGFSGVEIHTTLGLLGSADGDGVTVVEYVTVVDAVLDSDDEYVSLTEPTTLIDNQTDIVAGAD